MVQNLKRATESIMQSIVLTKWICHWTMRIYAVQCKIELWQIITGEGDWAVQLSHYRLRWQDARWGDCSRELPDLHSSNPCEINWKITDEIKIPTNDAKKKVHGVEKHTYLQRRPELEEECTGLRSERHGTGRSLIRIFVKGSEEIYQRK